MAKSLDELNKEALEFNKRVKEKERQQMTLKDKIKEWSIKILIYLFWILLGLYALKELKDTFFYSVDNPPERAYDPTQRSKN